MKYVALLRGINVGGKNIVKMAELRACLTASGFNDVSTYIQSGNIVFSSMSEDESELADLIKNEVDKHFNLTIPVIVKNRNFWFKMIASNPYLEKSVSKEELLASVTNVKEISVKSESPFKVGEPDEAIIGDQVIYLRCVGKYHKTKLTNSFLEKEFRAKFTTRNWKTVQKIANMLE